MLSPADERKGEQTPRLDIRKGEVAYTDGDDAELLFSIVSSELYPWQKQVLRCWCARDSYDKPAYTSCGLSVPRQNGKNQILEAYELYMLAVANAHILHTAHRVKTAKRSFRRLVKYFTNKKNEELFGQVEKICYTNGEEAIFLKNGASIEFSARSSANNRGYDDIQILVFDEAQELTDDQLSATLYTIAASSTGDRQVISTGTPPTAKSPGTVFSRDREAALTNRGKRLSWIEWSIEAPPPRGSTFSSVMELVHSTNPSMGYVLSLDNTEDEFNKATLMDFSVERLGYWEPAALTTTVISKDIWKSREIQAIGNAYKGKISFGIKFSPDGATYALVGCKLKGKRDKRAAFELVEIGTTEGGTKPLARMLWERRNTVSVVVIDGLAAAAALCDNLAELKCPVKYIYRPRTSDVISSAQGLIDDLKSESVVHTYSKALEASALGSARRQIGTQGGWGFGSTDSVESTPIEAAALALWGAKTTKRDPKRKQRSL